MYSTHNEGKSVVAERFIRTLKSKIYKYMTSISKNVYIDKLDNIVNEYNNTYHTTIKMKSIDVKDNAYINTDKEINNKDPTFKVGGRVRISKYKNIFAKGYTPNWFEEVFVIKKVKNTVPWTYVINDLNGEEFSSENIKVELDLSNYATKDDVKNITHIDASGFASKTNLAALKTEVDKIDTNKSKTVPNDLAKLGNVVKNDVVKKTDYNTLKSKVDGIDVSKYVGKTKYETDGKAIYDKIDAVEKKIPVLTDFVTTARFNHEKNLLAT